MTETVSIDSYVIVQRKSSMKLIKVKYGETVRIDKLIIALDSIVNKSYGYLYEVVDKKLVIADDQFADQEEAFSISDLIESDSGDVIHERDNRFILDEGNKIQKLTSDEINSLKQEGISGRELISRLIENSETFADKSCYAQAKYVKRKAKKHYQYVRLLKPTLHLLCEMYYTKDAERLLNLRIDRLSLILLLADVASGRKILLMEQCCGLLTVGVLQRLNGNGVCLHLHKGPVPQSIPAVHAMQLGDVIMSTFFSLPYCEVFASLSVQLVEMSNAKKRKVHSTKQAVSDKKDQYYSVSVSNAVKLYESDEFDSLILATNFDIVSLLKILVPKLLPSSPIVIYSPFEQVMIDSFNYLKDTERAVNLQIHDSFFREYQMIPQRTHPLMTQNIAGGYILSGYSVMA